MKLSQICIERPVFATVLSLLVVLLGIIGFLRISVRGYPNVESPVVLINTNYEGASPSIIESQITTPIENNLVGISGLDTLRSYSMQGLSRVILKFNHGVDINAAVNDVRDRLARISRLLPENADQPIIEKHNPDDLETMVLALTDPKLSTLALTDYAQRYLVPQIEQVEGVSTVGIYNKRDYAMRIEPVVTKMVANKVTINDLINTLQQQNVNIPSGQIKGLERAYSVLLKGQLSSAPAFRQLIIREKGGYLLRFSDVANISVAPEDSDSAMRVNGKPAIGLGIYSEANANPIQVAQRIQRKINRLNDSLPQTMQLRVIWNGTTYLKASLDAVYHDLLFAIVLVVLIIALFLGSLRSALIPAITIPICLIGVFALIYALGYSINAFTLLALVLAIGLVVDDAIVMLENIYRHIERGSSPLNAAITGSREIAFAIIAMTLTLAAVYAPIGFTQGMTGIIFREFAFTLALAVLLSGFVALTLSPMMCSKLLRLPNKQRSFTQRYQGWLDKVFHWLTSGYKSLLSQLLNHRIIITLLLVIVLALGIWIFTTMSMSLTPKEDMGAFLTFSRAPANTSFQYTNRKSKAIEQMLASLPGVDNVLTVVSPSYVFTWVILKPWLERNMSAQQLIKQATKKAKNIAGIHLNAFNVSQIGGGGRYGDAIRLVIMTDQSYEQLDKVVRAMMKKMRQFPGVANVSQDLQINYQQYVIKINQTLAATLKVNVAEINQALKTMLGGAKVTTFNWQDRDYNVILQLPQAQLQNLKAIDQLYVRNQNNQMIPLSSLATIETMIGPSMLPHEDRLRSDVVTMQLTPGYAMGSVVGYLQNTLQSMLPEGYQFRFKGEAKRLLESRHSTLGSFLLALLFIYLVLSAQFESFIDPFIILLTVPLSIVGALFTLKITNNSLSIYTNIGFVTLIGLVSKHGILITEFANQLRTQGQPLRQAIIEASALRLRPILMTTAAMVIGAIPLALASGPGAISRHHIGWVIVGGLLFGTFFSLVIVPIAYSILGRLRR